MYFNVLEERYDVSPLARNLHHFTIANNECTQKKKPKTSWAMMVTGRDGKYEFKTILPGSYPADNSGWIRPPHIHFRIARRAHHELTTQMYFADQELNERDRILQALPSAEQDRVIVSFAPDSAHAGMLAGRFNIVLPRA